ncbi:MAG: hypothetical protein FJ279_20585, partial [Planctomycetes bacterium]|nr:hypothetical protein [Planctomycetota bacterium]
MPESALAFMELFVSPRGNDKWSGRLKEPNAEKTDGPLATVQAAQQRIRGLKDGGRPATAAYAPAGITRPVVVWLRGGRYPI